MRDLRSVDPEAVWVNLLRAAVAAFFAFFDFVPVVADLVLFNRSRQAWLAVGAAFSFEIFF